MYRGIILVLYCTLFVPQTSCHLFQLICPPMQSRETRNNDGGSKPLGSPNGPGYYPHEKSLFWTGEEIAGSAITGSATTGSTSSPEVELSPRCRADTESVVQGVEDGEEWARKMVDSAGTVGSGVVDGNTFWLGSYDTCLSTTPPPGVNKTNLAFDTTYCLLSVTAMVRTNVVTSAQLGVCVASSCSVDDTILLSQLNPQYFGAFTNETLTINSAKCQPHHRQLDAPAIAVISLLSVLGLLVLVGTLYDILGVRRIGCPKSSSQAQLTSSYHNYDDDIAPPPEDADETGSGVEAPSYGTFSQKKEENEYYKAGKSDIPDGMEVGSTERLVQRSNVKVDDNEAPQQPGHLFGDLLVSFSLYTNGGKLLGVKRTTNELTSLHGLRFFSMTWVMLWHTIFHWWLSFGSLRNTNAIFKYLERFEFQVGINATLAVDTFFVVSGLLVSYLLLGDIEKKKGPKAVSWVRFYVHRFWRLTPPYMLVLGMWAALFKYLGDGPVWPQNGPDQWCATNWWANLLYINNLVKPNQMCMGHSWFLSNDMQFYVISPFIIVPFFLHWVAGTVVSVVVAVVSIVAIAVVVIINQYPAGTVGIFKDLSKQQGWWVDAYVAPWNHIAPYVVGIGLGYILYRTERKIQLNKAVVAVGWLTATIVNVAVVYGLYGVAVGQPTSAAVSALYNCLHRPAWSLGVAWVVLACSTGYGGPVNALLSWRPLVPLSRLTYMAYLIHPGIMQWFYYSRRTPVQWDDGSLIYIHLGHIVLSYSAALVLTLTLEMPWMALEKAILKTRKE